MYSVALIALINKHFQALLNCLRVKNDALDNQEFEMAADMRDLEDELIGHIKMNLLKCKSSKIPIHIFMQKDVENLPEDAILISSYNEFVYFINVFGLPDFISFQFDLDGNKTGFDCAIFLIKYCILQQVNLPKYAVHNDGPEDLESIKMFLKINQCLFEEI